MQRDATPILFEPFFPFGRQVMARSIVNDEKDFATLVFRNEALEKPPEGLAIEHVGKPVGEVGVVKRNCAKKMRSFPRAVGVDPRLTAHSRPGSMKSTVEPEAGLILEQDYAAAGSSFFLIRGSVTRSQYSCRLWSARASRLRGRCTENPSLCKSGGM